MTQPEAGAPLVAAVVVPDEGAWTLWGRDPRAEGIEPVAAPERATALVLPEPVPEPLAAAVLEAWSRMPAPRRRLAWRHALEGRAVAELFSGDREAAAQPAHGDHGARVGHGAHEMGHGRQSMAHDHEAMDHGDMMAITGEPSADGLVMESIEFELGPLAASLPGGLVLDLSLDGDVVERCSPRATLSVDARGADPLAPSASAAAHARAGERSAKSSPGEGELRLRIAAVEVERALSHLVWLRRFGGLLGWSELTERAHRAALSLIAPYELLRARGSSAAEPRSALEAGRALVEPLGNWLEGSRRLRARTRGRSPVDRKRLEESDLGGVVARASGIARDARSDDPLYESLGFRPETRPEGDAEARTLLRVADAVEGLRLAATALADAGDPPDARPSRPAIEASGHGPAPTEVAIEGPRGLVLASTRSDGPPLLRVPGQDEVLALAGEAVSGLELAPALVGLASFDLSGWRVGA